MGKASSARCLRAWRRLALPVLLVSALWLPRCSIPAARKLPVLTTILDIRRLTPEGCRALSSQPQGHYRLSRSALENPGGPGPHLGYSGGCARSADRSGRRALDSRDHRARRHFPDHSERHRGPAGASNCAFVAMSVLHAVFGIMTDVPIYRRAESCSLMQPCRLTGQSFLTFPGWRCSEVVE